MMMFRVDVMPEVNVRDDVDDAVNDNLLNHVVRAQLM